MLQKQRQLRIISIISHNCFAIFSSRINININININIYILNKFNALTMIHYLLSTRSLVNIQIYFLYNVHSHRKIIHKIFLIKALKRSSRRIFNDFYHNWTATKLEAKSNSDHL